MPTVTVLHPWLPAYRVPFFEASVERLAGAGVNLDVWYGEPPPEVAARGDGMAASWAHCSRTRYLSLGGRTLALHSLPASARSSDLLILEQAIRNLETYPALLRSTLGGTPLVLWGHGRTYTKDHSQFEESWKRLITSRAHWFFAYTQGGADLLEARGFARDRITVIQNSVSTLEIDLARERISFGELASFREAHGLVQGRTALFIGGLDESKRLDFLIASSRKIRQQLPGFKLVVAGDGSLRGVVEAAIPEGWLVYLGRASDAEKGLLSRACSLMMMPGRVGLAIVDAFAMRTPLFTTAWPYHAPEFEYLEHGVNGVVTPDRVDSYADAVVRYLREPAALELLRRGCEVSAETFSLGAMVENFCTGTLRALDSSARK